MTVLQGRVVEVVTETQGGVCAGLWEGNRLPVVDAADFCREGGMFQLEGRQYAFTGVEDGPVDVDGVPSGPDVLLTVDAAPAPAGVDVRVDVWPLAQETFAEVEVSEDVEGSVRALVPHTMVPLMPDGSRSSESAEWVTIEPRGLSEWVVASIEGRRPVISVEALAPEVLAAMESASGKNAVTHATAAPSASAPGAAAGDTWFQHDQAGHTVGMWHWDGAAWQSMTIDGQVIANLDAGTITTGTLTGVKVSGGELWSPADGREPDPQGSQLGGVWVRFGTLLLKGPVDPSTGTEGSLLLSPPAYGRSLTIPFMLRDSAQNIKTHLSPDGVWWSRVIRGASIQLAPSALGSEAPVDVAPYTASARVLTPSVMNGGAAAWDGSAHVTRVGNMVTIQAYLLVKAAGPFVGMARANTAPLGLPSGFLPVFSSYDVPVGVASCPSGNATLRWDKTGRRLYLSGASGTWAAGDALTFTATWPTNEAWPA